MDLKEGDILQRGLLFYRVYSTSKRDVVINKILYNPKIDRLQIYHGYEIVTWDQIGEGKFYSPLKEEESDTLSKLELVKRKYKLQRLKKNQEEN